MKVLEHRQEQLVAALGHELRNPLGAALTGVTLLQEMVDTADPRRPFVDRALDDLERLSRLLTGYLDLARASRPRRDRFDLASLLARVLRRRSGGVALHAEASVEVVGDAGLLERVVENLVDNAFDAGASRVVVNCKRRADEAVLRFTDDGPGVPQELRDRLFEPGLSGRGSSGLGLAIVADIVESHGGEVRLLPSTAGARFQVILPAVRDQERELCCSGAPDNTLPS